MASQVMALKWRPQVFADMVGQEHISRTLQNAFTTKHLAHAYIFSGPRGVGKTTTARIFAKLLNCLSPKGDEPCNACDLCIEVNQGSSLDVIEIDAASVNGVDDIRELQKQVGTYPAKGKYKVYIFDEAHRISKNAFDAFLKTLEEPPEHVVFVMASTEVHSFPATVQSRCQRLEFKSMGLDTLVKQLRHIADAEKITADDKVLQLVARTAGGSMRDAQRTLDQLVAFSNGEITLEDARRVLGLVEGDLYVKLAAAALSGDGAASLDLIRGVVESGKDLEQFYRGWMETYRHLAVARAYPAKAAELLPLPAEETAALSGLAQGADEALLLSSLRLLIEQEWPLRHSIVPSVVLETLALELSALRRLVSVDDALARAEKGLPPPAPRAASPAAPKAPAPVVAVPRPSPATPPSAQVQEPGEPVLAVSEIEEPSDSDTDPHLAAIRAQWREIVEKAGQQKKSIQGILLDCRPKSFEGGTLVLSCKSSFHQAQIQDPKNARLIEQVLESVLNLQAKVVPVLAAEGPQARTTSHGAPKPQSRPRVDVQALQKEEPLVKAVMEMFDGKVVDVVRPNKTNQ